jgi:hypothetical protein
VRNDRWSVAAVSTAVAIELMRDEAHELREDLDYGARRINEAIRTAKTAADLTRWQRRKLVHQDLTVKLVVALREAGL